MCGGPVAEFDRFAGDYRSVLDGAVGSAQYYARAKALAAVTQVGADFAGKVLDYGCGVGLLAAALLQLSPRAQLTGFDVSAPCLHSIGEPLRSAATWSSEPVELADCYDLIVISNVLHHVVPAERDSLLGELANRLKSGGKLLIFEHNPLNPLTRWVVAHCAFDDDAVLLWPRETQARLRTAGLQSQGCDYLAFFPQRLARFQPAERHLAGLPLGAQYMAVGHKP